MKRRIAREKAVQSLFQIDMSSTDRDEAIENVLEGEERDSFLVQLVYGTTDHLEEIDNILKDHLEKWTLNRVANVDRAILRLAVHEMMFEKDIPVNVSMNEAIELAKVFSGEESSRFINGVLSKIIKKM
ncbi:transcription antitermination factor NusB [Bacillus taeanensis]|uniref:Transcription antitermination protein NusB n=1 Tax=Bacillus taeanensis TaxID=273032 RepID=A0A366XYG3_9BACI|nr:transcription antitermination factor NusB [Bacillus taeanensis]RBW70608.1 transcription antitermination factor NusB [Bacillus taeanensis]